MSEEVGGPLCALEAALYSFAALVTLWAACENLLRPRWTEYKRHLRAIFGTLRCLAGHNRRDEVVAEVLSSLLILDPLQSKTTPCHAIPSTYDSVESTAGKSPPSASRWPLFSVRQLYRCLQRDCPAITAGCQHYTFIH
jgi:hypothetical protein